MRVQTLVSGTKWTVCALIQHESGRAQVFEFLQQQGPHNPAAVRKLGTLWRHLAERTEGPGCLNLEQSHDLGEVGMVALQSGKTVRMWEFIAGRLRVFYFCDGPDRVVICTNGYLKKSQKVNRSELELAKRACRQYFDTKMEIQR